MPPALRRLTARQTWSGYWTLTLLRANAVPRQEGSPTPCGGRIRAVGGAPEVPGSPRECPGTAETRRSPWAVDRDDPDPNSASLDGHGGHPTACGGLISQTNKVGMSLSPIVATLATASEGRYPAMASRPLHVSDALLMRMTPGGERFRRSSARA